MRLRPVTLIVTFALGLLAGPLPAEAQKAGKVFRVGYLTSQIGSPATNSMYLAFRQGLRELGYVEGQNLVLEYRSPKREHRQKVAIELVRLKVHVIVVPHGPPNIRAVQRATRTIPIVLAGVHVDPAESGLVDSLFLCDIGTFATIQEAIMKLRTIGLISTLVLGLLAGPLPAEAQQAGKVYRVGY